MVGARRCAQLPRRDTRWFSGTSPATSAQRSVFAPASSSGKPIRGMASCSLSKSPHCSELHGKIHAPHSHSLRCRQPFAAQTVALLAGARRESSLCCLSIATSLLLLTCASKGSFSHTPHLGFVRFKPRSVIFWRGPFCCAPSEYLQSSLHKGACGSNTS